MIRRAKYLGVPPWVLMEQPTFWSQWADIAEQAEIEAHNEQVREQNKGS